MPVTIRVRAVSSAFHTRTPWYDSKPVHRLSCLSSSRPGGFDFLDTWLGWSLGRVRDDDDDEILNHIVGLAWSKAHIPRCNFR